MTTFASWNVNGIRACTKNGFLTWFRKYPFDVVGLQEVRAMEDQIPPEILDIKDYVKIWHLAEKKGYSGVGILSKFEPEKVHYGMGSKEFDCEGRVLTAEFKKFVFLSVYFPNSRDGGARLDYKIRFCKTLHQWLNEMKKTKKPVILTGDFNIAHHPIDLARPDDNEETAGYLPEERTWMTEYLNSGWIDTFRHLNPNVKDRYSWWSARTRARPRNIGWRIDYFTIDKASASLIKSADIQDQVMGSDHCPVTLSLDV